jgi:predicted membrane chloride channel (bestrophin family)
MVGSLTILNGKSSFSNANLLSGIDAIGAQLEDPFGYDKADIKVDAIVEDLRVRIFQSATCCVKLEFTAKRSYTNADAFLTGRDECTDR